MKRLLWSSLHVEEQWLLASRPVSPILGIKVHPLVYCTACASKSTVTFSPSPRPDFLVEHVQCVSEPQGEEGGSRTEWHRCKSIIEVMALHYISQNPYCHRLTSHAIPYLYPT